MKSILRYALFLIICCFLTLFVVGLSSSEINAQTPAEELVSIDNELARLDEVLSVLHKARLHNENCLNADYVLVLPTPGGKDRIGYFAISKERLHELAASSVFDFIVKFDHSSYQLAYFDLVTAFALLSKENRSSVRTKLAEIMERIEMEQKKVLRLRDRKKAILSGQLEPIPLTLNECETETATICGTWTLKDGAYHALWNNGAKAVINIVRFDDENVIFTRHDKTGSSKGLRADYIGKRVSDRKAEGTVNWTWNNDEWTGTWYATWQKQ